MPQDPSFSHPSEKRTVLHLLYKGASQFPDTPYTCEKGDEGWIRATYSQVLEESRRLASGLKELGFSKGDKIGLLSEGRNRWIISEFGILFCGCTCVPLSIKLLPEEVHFRVSHSEAKGLIVSRNTFEKAAAIWRKIKKNVKLIYLDDDLTPLIGHCSEFGIDIEKDIFRFADIKENGSSHLDKNEVRLKDIERNTEEDDVVTISYTSGTTGDPKGIMLTHLNYWSNSSSAVEYFNLNRGDRLYIILPLDHAFAHTVAIYAGLLRGLSLYFVDARGGGLQTLKNIPLNMLEANPHFILTVPALSGNFMQKITDGVSAKGRLVKGLFQSGLRAGRKINQDGFRRGGLFTRLFHFLPHKLADLLVFSKVRKIFGTNLRYCVGGGALLDIQQQHFFAALGIPIYQGYGLTEATPIISANSPDIHKYGTSGRVLPDITCKIMRDEDHECSQGEKGEIVIKGPNVMKGYYKNETATAKTIKNGWLLTGDLGYIDEDDFLVVVGREKALLISADGEKYSPESIEEAILNASRFIHQALVFNDMRKSTTALITLHADKVQKAALKQRITDPEILLKVIQQDLNRYKSVDVYRNRFPEKWTPSNFQVISEPFSEEKKMINSTMKMVRHKIIEYYRERIEYMYSSEGSSFVNDLNMEAVKNYLPF